MAIAMGGQRLAWTSPIRSWLWSDYVAPVGRSATAIAGMVADVCGRDRAIPSLHTEPVGAGMDVRKHRRADSGSNERIAVRSQHLESAERTGQQRRIWTCVRPGTGVDRSDCSDVRALQSSAAGAGDLLVGAKRK